MAKFPRDLPADRNNGNDPSCSCKPPFQCCVETSDMLNPAPLGDNSVSTTVQEGALIGASSGDLPRGYSDVTEKMPPWQDRREKTNTIFPEEFGGFLGRYHGYDR